MTSHVREISKEQYERARANHGYITDEDENAVFSQSELLGYGVYGAVVYQDGDKYYVRYSLGSSCD